MKKLVILDRDGVINIRPSAPERYILNENEVECHSDVIDWIARATRRISVCVATNQQGVGKKLLSREKLDEIHSRINLEIRNQGGLNLLYFVCPHLESDKCMCRKPRPGLLKIALEHFEVEAKDSIFVGDTETDLLAAETLNVDYLDIDDFRCRIRANPNFLFALAT